MVDSPEEATMIYPLPGWRPQKPDPKKGVTNASWWKLDLVESLHWLIFFFVFGEVFAIFQHAPILQAGSKIGVFSRLQVFFLMMSAVAQAIGGFVAVIMHEYEGWQVAPFANPFEGRVNVRLNNNAWLRAIIYEFLLLYQNAGFILFCLGAWGSGGIWPRRFAWWAGLSSLVSFLGPRKTLKINLGWGPVFPASFCVLVPFFINSIIYFYAYVSVFSRLSLLNGWLAFFAIASLVGGGVLEGLVAETSFNQFWHGFAVIFVNIGAALKWWMVTQIT